MWTNRFVASLSIASALMLASAGCGDSQSIPSAEEVSAVPKPAIRTTVYLLAEDGAAPLGVRRALDRNSPYAREALKTLLSGPTAAERKRGMTTAIPSRARLTSLTLKGRDRAVALISLTGLPPAQGRQGEEASLGMRVRVITQIARTLIGLSGVARVEISVDRKPWDLWTMDGRIVRTQTGYDRLRGWTRICGDRSPEERKLGFSRCFSALP
jgi:spore germination protein GerM